MSLRSLTRLDVGSTEDAEFLHLCKVLSMARSTPCIHCPRELEYPLELGTMLGTQWAANIAEKRHGLHHITEFQTKVRDGESCSTSFWFPCQVFMPPTVAGSSNALNSHVLSASANVEQLWQYCSAQATNWQRIESICHLACTLFIARLEFLRIGSFSKVALTQDRQWYQPSAVCWALSGLRCIHISFLGWSGA